MSNVFHKNEQIHIHNQDAVQHSSTPQEQSSMVIDNTPIISASSLNPAVSDFVPQSSYTTTPIVVQPQR